jgi:predicted nucleotidyltransferase
VSRDEKLHDEYTKMAIKAIVRDQHSQALLLSLPVYHTPASIPNLFELTRMEAEISDLIGKKVDLRTAGDLSRYFRSQVLATAVPQYAA